MDLGEMLESDIKTKPHRRYTMRIDIGADSREELYLALVEIEKEFIAGVPWGTTAGPSVGYSFCVEEDPSVTHETYFEDLDRWLEQE